MWGLTTSRREANGCEESCKEACEESREEGCQEGSQEEVVSFKRIDLQDWTPRSTFSGRVQNESVVGEAPFIDEIQEGLSLGSSPDVLDRLVAT